MPAPVDDKSNRPARLHWSDAVGGGVVIAVTLVLAAWRVAYVLGGPDPDSDAYGHHTIARSILDRPGDLRVHWVWLPLFHYAQALGLLFGLSFTGVRLINVGISTAIPLVLYLLLASRARAGGSDLPTSAPATPPSPLETAVVPAIAALVCALSPLGMQMGTTGQTEPIFCLFVLAIAWTLDRDRTGLCAGILSAAVLTRYEAWPILAGIALLLAADRLLVRRGVRWWKSPRWIAHDPRRAWLVVVCPLLAILFWAALLRGRDGRWFYFLQQTRQFANVAMKAKSSLDWGVSQLFLDILHYPVSTPWRVMSYPLLLVPFGVVRALRRQGITFAVVYLSVLAFITFAWISRASLGLDRHFMALVPFYAVLCASGAAEIGRGLRSIVDRYSARAGLWAEAGAAVAIGLLAVALTYARFSVWWTHWQSTSRELWPERRAVAAFLRTLPENATIFCDEATIEVMSGLDRHRFDRRSIITPQARDRIVQSAEKNGEAFIASWAVRVQKVRDLGQVVYRPQGAAGDENGPTVVRVAAGGIQENPP